MQERGALGAFPGPFSFRHLWSRVTGPGSPPPLPQVLPPEASDRPRALCSLSGRCLLGARRGREDPPGFGGPQPGGAQSGPGLPPTPASLAFPGTGPSALHSRSQDALRPAGPRCLSLCPCSGRQTSPATSEHSWTPGTFGLPQEEVYFKLSGEPDFEVGSHPTEAPRPAACMGLPLASPCPAAAVPGPKAAVFSRNKLQNPLAKRGAYFICLENCLGVGKIKPAAAFRNEKLEALFRNAP